MRSNNKIAFDWSNALMLMRVPFSLFLMPIFWFALSSSGLKWAEHRSLAMGIFFILHILVYPASNGYNSFYDKDEDSVGGLEKPPAVTRHLYYLVLAFDAAAIVLSLFINLYFAIGILVYLMVSKAYSYDKIRLKKYPILSTAVVTVFQGMFVYILVLVGLCGDLMCLGKRELLYAVIATLFLLGSYPLTQIYQHASDAKRGDMTLSRLLGIQGTFLFSALFFGLATTLFVYLKFEQGLLMHIYTYLIISFPIIAYFGWWSISAFKDSSKIDYRHAMLMNKISSLSMSLIFIVNLFL